MDRCFHIHFIGNVDNGKLAFVELEIGTRYATINGHCLYILARKVYGFIIYSKVINPFWPVVNIFFSFIRYQLGFCTKSDKHC